MCVNSKLEVCVDSVESALAAVRGGADRLELCSNLIIGGTSPSLCLFREIKKNCDIKVHVLLRPRFGDFCYSDYEYRVIKEEVKMFRDVGADGAVIGILKADGSLDVSRMEKLVKEAGNMSVTLHRAFDLCKDPYVALEEAIALGIDTILTSGQQDTCSKGKDLIKELSEKGLGKIRIMAGAGVTAEVIEQILPICSDIDFHMSGKVVKQSEMEFRRPEVNMGLPAFSEDEIYQTEEQKIREAKNLLRAGE